MGVPAVSKKRCLIIKQESARGAYTAPADADFNIPFFDISYTVEKPITEGKYSTGDFDTYAGIVGKSSGTITASVYLSHSGTVDVQPQMAKALTMCGVGGTINASTNVVYAPSSNYEVGVGDLSFSCLIQDQTAGDGSAISHKFLGCLANGKLVMEDVGMPWRLDLEITGIFDGTDDITALVPTGLDTTVPNSIKSATITNATIAQRVSSFEIDFGNVLELENDPSETSGYTAAVIVDSNPVVSFDPLADLLSNDAVYTRWDAGTEGVLGIASSNWSFDATKAQIITVADATQGSLIAYSQTLRLNRPTATTEGAWSLTHT